MNRRRFMARSGAALAAMGASPSFLAGAAQESVYKRLALTTVTFRNRFTQTRPETGFDDLPPLTLLEVPQYFRDRFRIRNVEFWSRHFESTSDDYLEKLREKVSYAGSKLVNILLDGPYDVSNPNEEERQKSIALVKGWIDTARKVGAQGIRVNPGSYDVGKSINSFRVLAGYAAENELTLYVENHMGFGKFPDKMLQIAKAIKNDNFKLITDFANFDASIKQLEGIRSLIPYTGLISAKALYIDQEGDHPPYDYQACITAAEQAGYTGIYSAEYYDSKNRHIDPEAVADWMLKNLKTVL